jgi:hypothetical protein
MQRWNRETFIPEMEHRSAPLLLNSLLIHRNLPDEFWSGTLGCLTGKFAG